MKACVCQICRYETSRPHSQDLGTVRGNTERFKDTVYPLWKCPECQTIHSIDPVDYQDIYADYPLNKRRFDAFARGTMRNLLKRLKNAGLKKTDAILDYGCGNGLFVQFLKRKGFTHTIGYDPYVPEFSELPSPALFDCIIANDVIEHVTDPRAIVQDCMNKLKPGGLLYVGTADSEGVDMKNLEPHIMRLHQPFHRIIITEETLHGLCRETGAEIVASYRRSYMDTLIPFANYRFLDEFSKALGHNMDRALNPAAGLVVIKRPALLFYAFWGYFFPSAYEPAVVVRKPE
jgi:2-polyprenyl-3-methyl-5-hydroxy-6-metoxy-1,4-benzoquinol methylase